jgi:hypothetical protein
MALYYGKEMLVLIYIIIIIEVYLEKASPSHLLAPRALLASSSLCFCPFAIVPVLRSGLPLSQTSTFYPRPSTTAHLTASRPYHSTSIALANHPITHLIQAHHQAYRKQYWQRPQPSKH